MKFAEHSLLWIGTFALVILALALYGSWRRKQSLLTQFVDSQLLQKMLVGIDPRWQKGRLILIVAVSAFLWLSLARPQWGEDWQEATQRGRDILVAIDTSRSMLANDVIPNRLARAKMASLDLMSLARHDRLGLIAFAGNAFVQCPLTLDEDAFRQSVNILDTGIIPQGGTSMTAAIEAALGTFKNDEGDNHKVLIILTDGEDHEEGVKEIAIKAAKAGLIIFTVGVGTPAGELLRVKDDQGKDSFVKDDQGNVVKSTLNESLLRDIASVAKGFYISLRENKSMEVLYEQGLRPLPTTELSSKMVKSFHERYRWPLALAVLGLILEIFWPESGLRKRKPMTITAAILLFFLKNADAAYASPKRAQRDFEKGEFRKAQDEYDRLLASDPEDSRLQYNSGNSAYAAKDYSTAAKRFEGALAAKDKTLQQHAYYNLGNAEFRQGMQETNPEQKQQQWEQALQHFEESLKLDPKDEDATHNLELVRKQLEELKKQQQNKPDKEKSKDQDDQKNEDKKDSKDNPDQKNESPEDQKKDGDKQQPSESDKKDPSQDNKPDNKEDNSQEPKEQKKEDSSKAEEDKKQAEKQNSSEQKNDEQSEEASDEKSAQLGQMTPTQARQMLEAQKGEEKVMIFLPAKDAKKASRDRIFKDW